MGQFFKPTATKIAVFVLASIVLGALLAPPLYTGGKHVVEQGWIEDGFLKSIHGSMDRATFARYFNRALTFAAVLLLWPTIAWIRRDQPERDGRGALLLEKNPRKWKHVIVGFLAACVPLFILGFIYVQVGLYKPHTPDKAFYEIVLSALTAAVAVALLEEFIFRGALMALLLRTAKPMPVLIFLTAFFAIVHFLQPPKTPEFEKILKTLEINWLSGFWIIGQIFGQFGNWKFLAAEFALLFAVGWILGYVRLKTASLWLSTGLHAGWVFGIKMFSPLTRRNFKVDENLPWLGESLRIGANSMLVVALTGLGIWLWLKKSEAKDRDPFADRNGG